MGFLDKKERILDVVLTAEGKKLLAQNDLDFTYYAFSDDGIDYSGSLDASRSKLQSFDAYIARENLTEATENNDSIKNYLYTSDPTQETLPEMVVSSENLNSNLSFTITRAYTTEESIQSFWENINKHSNNEGVIMRADVEESALSDRKKEKILEDLTETSYVEMLTNGGNLIGMPLGNNYIVVDASAGDGENPPIIHKVVDKRDGRFLDIDEIQTIEDDPLRFLNFSDNEKQNIEIVKSLSQERVEIKLKQGSGAVLNTKGFLVEVYLSSSDKKLQKLPAEDTIRDVESGEVVEKGFLNYLSIETE